MLDGSLMLFKADILAGSGKMPFEDNVLQVLVLGLQMYIVKVDF